MHRYANTSILLLLLLSGCTPGNIRKVSIDGHEFQVPKKNLARTSWLHIGRNNGFLFVINPDAPLPRQISVLVQPIAAVCYPQNPPANNELATTCEAAKKGAKTEAWSDNFKLEKVVANKGDPWWIYRLKEPGMENPGKIIASCSAMASGDGLCYSLNNYHNLIYNIGLNESELVHLPEIRKMIDQQLSSWEKR